MANREFPVPDFFVKTLRVYGASTHDGLMTISDQMVFSHATSLWFGGTTGTDSRITPYSSAYNELKWGLSSATGRQLVITDTANLSNDHDHATTTNPTLFIHSATAPDTANDEWISLSHDATDAVITQGSGTLNLTDVNFTNATATGSADAAMNAYVEIEVAGVLKRFMLTA